MTAVGLSSVWILSEMWEHTNSGWFSAFSLRAFCWARSVKQVCRCGDVKSASYGHWLPSGPQQRDNRRSPAFALLLLSLMFVLFTVAVFVSSALSSFPLTRAGRHMLFNLAVEVGEGCAEARFGHIDDASSGGKNPCLDCSRNGPARHCGWPRRRR